MTAAEWGSDDLVTGLAVNKCLSVLVCLVGRTYLRRFWIGFRFRFLRCIRDISWQRFVALHADTAVPGGIVTSTVLTVPHGCLRSAGYVSMVYGRDSSGVLGEQEQQVAMLAFLYGH